MTAGEKILRLLESPLFRVGLCRAKPDLFGTACRQKPDFEPRGVIVVLFPYKVERGGDCNLCAYASVPDYHAVAGGYLGKMTEKLKASFPDGRFRFFIDSSCVNEVRAASRAGLGVFGDNRLLINPEFGTYFFIGCILTDLDTGCADAEPRFCLKCGRCRAACPTGTLRAGAYDPGTCLSYITQKKGELGEREKRLVREGGLIWGCDVCQQVCPMNEGARCTLIPEFLNGAVWHADAGFIKSASDRAFLWHGTAPLLRNLEITGEKEEGGEK